MWSQISCPPIYNGTSPLPEHSVEVAYTEFGRIVISCMVIWTTIADGDMITLNEFIHLYHLKASKEFRYYEFVP